MVLLYFIRARNAGQHNVYAMVNVSDATNPSCPRLMSSLTPSLGLLFYYLFVKDGCCERPGVVVLRANVCINSVG